VSNTYLTVINRLHLVVKIKILLIDIKWQLISAELNPWFVTDISVYYFFLYSWPVVSDRSCVPQLILTVRLYEVEKLISVI